MSLRSYSSTAFPDKIGQKLQRWPIYESIVSDRTLPAGDQASSITGGLNVLWTYSLAWTVLTQAEAQSLLHAVEFTGAVNGLYFFEWISRAATNAYVGLGAGTAVKLTLPFKGGASGTTTVKVNGTPITGTFSSATGPNLEDEFTPSAAIASGATIRVDFTGRRRRKVTVLDGSTNSFRLTVRPNTSPLIFQAQIELIETEYSEL